MTGLDIVFGALICLGERAHAACHEEDHAVHRPAIGRIEFGAVLDRQAARGTRSDEDQPAILAKPRGGSFGGTGDGCRLRMDRGYGRHLAFEHRLHSQFGRPEVEIAVTGVERFSIHDVLLSLSRDRYSAGAISSPESLETEPAGAAQTTKATTVPMQSWKGNERLLSTLGMPMTWAMPG